MNITQGTQLGRYQLVSLLGAGGMAEVWKARILGPAGFERTVVVKRVLSHLSRDAAFVEMFLAEAKLSALLAHPNIVQVHELGQEQGEYFMAMEYVQGCDLGRVLRRGNALPIGFAVMVAQAVCRALSYAHAMRDGTGTPLGLVHRDVNPANIMLGREGTVKLLDFGIAKALGASTDHQTQTGTLKGKLGYMSPEQVDGQPIDHRSDLFAVGIVLYEILTNQRLFKAATDFLTLSNTRDADVLPPSHVNPAIPAALDAICLKALARDPRQRFTSGDEMAAALEPFLERWTPDRLRPMIEAVLAEHEEHAECIGPTLTAEAPVETSVDTIPRYRTPISRPAPRTRWWRVGVAAALTLGVAGAAIHLADSKAPRATITPAPRTSEPAVLIPAATAQPPAPAPPAVSAAAPPLSAGPPPIATTPKASTSQRKRTRPSSTASRATKPTVAPKPAKPDFDPESALP